MRHRVCVLFILRDKNGVDEVIMRDWWKVFILNVLIGRWLTCPDIWILTYVQKVGINKYEYLRTN